MGGSADILRALQMVKEYGQSDMNVPGRAYVSWVALLGLLAATLLPSPHLLAEHAPTVQRIALADIGFVPQNTQFLLNGGSMLSLHYVDDKHLLVTYTVRRLLPRLPDDPAEDQDRTVEAALLELPSGHVLARSSWRTHDRAQYLWDLGDGHFLLRIRDTLSIFAPLANLDGGHAFDLTPFLVTQDRHIAAILVSPGGDLLTVESLAISTKEEQHEQLLGPIAGHDPALKRRNPVQINFYRLTHDSQHVTGTLAGVAQSAEVGDIAANGAGYLVTLDQGHQRYAFDFHVYTGKVVQLSPFDSTCAPLPVLVSGAEFIAFGCHQGQERRTLGGFNMRGEEVWEQNLFGDYLSPSLAFAPVTGRFALSRILTKSSFLPDQPISPELISAQTVVVFQASSGRQLLKIDCDPVARAGQNFTFSPDGQSFAVIRGDAIEIYALPTMTRQEQKDFALAQASAPSATAGSIQMAGTVAEDTSGSESVAIPSTAYGQSATKASTSDASPDQSSTSSPAKADPAVDSSPTESWGDEQPSEVEGHRKRPTLYTLPTDHPGDPSGASSPSGQPSIQEPK